MKFIADAMLGRLARWLRLLGLDTLYYPDITDRTLLKTSKQEKRLLLTRDTRLVQSKIADCLLIESDDVFEQLAQVVGTLGLREPEVPRCANCNGAMAEVEKKDVEGSVPEYVFLSHNRFMMCAECGRVYWEGSHYRDMRERLRKVMAG